MRTTARVAELWRAVNCVVSASQNSTSRAFALLWAIWSRAISPCWVMSIIALAFYHSHVSHDAATGGLHGSGVPWQVPIYTLPTEAITIAQHTHAVCVSISIHSAPITGATLQWNCNACHD